MSVYLLIELFNLEANWIIDYLIQTTNWTIGDDADFLSFLQFFK